MPNLVILCYPDEPPELRRLDQFSEPPDGCDSFMAVTIGGPAGLMPGLCVMPCNMQRPPEEVLSDYVTALSICKTFLQFRKVEKWDNFFKVHAQRMYEEFIHHCDDLMQLACEQAVNMGIDVMTVKTLVALGFEFGHTKCCEDPECKHDVSKKIHGSDQKS